MQVHARAPEPQEPQELEGGGRGLHGGCLLFFPLLLLCVHMLSLTFLKRRYSRQLCGTAVKPCSRGQIPPGDHCSGSWPGLQLAEHSEGSQCPRTGGLSRGHSLTRPWEGAHLPASLSVSLPLSCAHTLSVHRKHSQRFKGVGALVGHCTPVWLSVRMRPRPCPWRVTPSHILPCHSCGSAEKRLPYLSVCC